MLRDLSHDELKRKLQDAEDEWHLALDMATNPGLSRHERRWWERRRRALAAELVVELAAARE